MKILEKIGKVTGASVMSLGLVVGMSGFAGAMTGSITNTGPDSYNKIKVDVDKELTVTNNNDLRLKNRNTQNATSGDAKVLHNTTGGDATSGDAKNSNSLSVSATVNNAAGASAWAGALGGGGGSNSASIEQTGPDSYNVIKYESEVKVNIENNNDLSVKNYNTQNATSGDAKVIDNTTGGDATSGDASNTNATTVNMSVSN